MAYQPKYQQLTFFYSFLGVKFKERMVRVSTRISGAFSIGGNSYRASRHGARSRHRSTGTNNSHNRGGAGGGAGGNHVSSEGANGAGGADSRKRARSFRNGWMKRAGSGKIPMSGIVDDDTRKSTLQRTDVV